MECCCCLKHLLLEGEPKLFALEPQYLADHWVAAVEDCDLALVLLPQLREDLVPVGPEECSTVSYWISICILAF